MYALDGNALAGPLFEYFGSEMTTASGSCSHCGATRQVAELRVYASAPGMVARCPNCGGIAIVIVQARETLRVHSVTRFR
jgi:hypothetical protein